MIKSSIYILLLITICACTDPGINFDKEAIAVLQDSVLLIAKENVNKSPITITSNACERSIGGLHDFYSEGDYWWPDPDNPDSPYVRRDGLTNPNNFVAHRNALLRFSEIVGNLTSAYIITKDVVYANAAIDHCRAWLINENSKMNPHLLYAQAIKGRHTGRGIGIIDAIHFMEVVQSLIILEKQGLIDGAEMKAYRMWFSEFLEWLTTHPYGKDEMIHPNNHGTGWNMQVGLYAVFTKNDSILSFCRQNFKDNLLPNQMDIDGSFPRELARTKPYGYSLFNLDAMAMNCVVLSDEANDLWRYTTTENKSIHLGLEYMKPFVEDKNSWSMKPDVMYWENWPVAHPSFLFGSLAYIRSDFFDLWKNNQHFYETYEIRRNMPVKNPLIWMID
ncbi:MAG: alginate lyase family protein [Cyclobacteriaceae bacterium]